MRLKELGQLLGPPTHQCEAASACGGPGVMVLRRNSRDGQLFWGCSHYTHCAVTVSLEPGDVMLRRREVR